MLRNIILAACSVGFMTVAAAQSTPETAEVIIYKWKEGGVIHYAKQPPRGVGSVTMLDEQGLVISDDTDDQALFDAMRPVRPGQKAMATNEQSNMTEQKNGEAELPEGAISVEQRCMQARNDIITIQSVPEGKVINVEDENGNLVPMSDADKQKRLNDAQALVNRFCNQ